MTILMLCNNIEISKSERFKQTIETKINELEHFREKKDGYSYIRVAFT